MLTKLIRTLYYILFFATPLVMFSGTSEIFEFNKLIFIYVLTVFIGMLWLIQWILQKKRRFSITPFQWIVIVFVVSQVLSTLFSIDRQTSLFGYYGRFNGGLLSIIAYSVLFFVFFSESTLPFIKNILKISVVSSILVMLWGLPGKFNFDLSCGLFTGTFSNACWTNQFKPDERMFSTLGQPNWLGAYLAVTFFIGLYFYLKNSLEKDQPYWRPISWLFYLLFTFATVLFTGSRSALAAVVVGLLVFPLLYLYFKKKESFQLGRKQYLILGVLLIIPILLFKTGIEKVDSHLPFHQTQATAAKAITAKPASIDPNYNVTDSFDIRKIVWKGAWKLALQYPLFGSGVETFAYSYYFTRPVEHNATSEWDYLYNKAHNEFINYLATTGFVGFTAYMLMIAAVITVFFKRYFGKDKDLQLSEKELDDYRLLILCLFVSYLTIQITNFFGFSTTTISLFFYIVPAAFFVKHLDEPIQSEEKNKATIFQKGAVVATVLVVVYGLYFIGSYWVADMQYSQAQSEMRSGNYSQSAYTLLHILKYHYEHVYEDKLSVALIGTALSTDNKDDMQKLTFMSQYYNAKALEASPYNVLYWKSQATILYNIYQLNSDISYLKKAYQAIQTAEKLAPTDPRLPYAAAQYASALYDATKQKSNLAVAIKDVDISLKLKADYSDAFLMKSIIQMKLGKKVSAVK